MILHLIRQESINGTGKGLALYTIKYMQLLKWVLSITI